MKIDLQLKLLISSFVIVLYTSAQISHEKAIINKSKEKQFASFAHSHFSEDGKTSPAFVPSNKLLQIYDSLYTWKWDTLDANWKLDNKWVDITYDMNNNLTGGTNKIKQGISWINDSRFTDLYDSNNNNINYTDYSWNGSVWIYTEQTNYTYDSKNNQQSQVRQKWDGTSWKNESQYLYSYDLNNNMTVEIYQWPTGAGWKNAHKYAYAYDANNNKSTEVSQYWDSVSSSWKNSSQYFYTYTADNKLKLEQSQHWNGTTWVNGGRTTYTYANGNLTNRFFEYYNGSSWVNGSQSLYSHDSNNNQIRAVYQSWNGNAWVNRSDDKYTYDADHFQNSNVYISFNPSGNKITNGDSTIYYYHTVSTGIPFLLTASNQLKIYPNPSTGKFIVEVEQDHLINVEIYNLTGQKMLQQKSGVVDISSYPKGVYFVRVIANEQAYTERMILD